MHFAFFLALVLGVYCVDSKPNIIFILTDDQDVMLNSMIPLTNVQKLIGNEGAVFENSFVNTPVCCPSRSTILTGKYLHNTGVRNNSISGNCSSIHWQRNHEPFTFASILKSSGNYSTFYAGKYLNEYGNKKCGGIKYIPKGFDWWLGLKGNSRYYNYTLSINGTRKKFTNDYLTDVMKMYALNFLNQKHVQDLPFFMMLSTPAIHAPFIPAPRHRKMFPFTKAPRTPSFNYSSADKHWLIRLPPKTLPSDVSILDDIQKHRFQTLLAVDEMVGDVVSKLKEINVLDKTYIIFTSDNGFHIGQFVQPWDKRQPYETDIRVPLILRGPNIKAKQVVTVPVSSVDIAPTILDMANLEIPDYIDGKSFFDQLSKFEKDFKSNILIEYFGEGDENKIDKRCPWFYDKNVAECTIDNWCKCQDSRNNTYVCIRRLSDDTDFKFCRFRDNENFFEAYDLSSDPYELKNIYSKMNTYEITDYQKTIDKLQHCKGRECHL